jgi:hypothetical protein
LSVTNIQDFARKYADFIEKIWADPALLEKLHAQPVETLAAQDIVVQGGATVNIVMRVLDRSAKLAEQFGLWETGMRTGIYDIIIPIRPDAGSILIPEGGEGGCCCCPCTCT